MNHRSNIFVGKRVVIIATTDYTHYGPGYGQTRAENLSEKILNNQTGQWQLLSYNVSSEVLKRGKDVCGFASLVYS